MGPFHGAKQPLFEAFVFLFHGPEPILGPLAGGDPIHGAAALDHRQALVLYCLADVVLWGKDHRPDHGQILAGKIGDRGKAADPPLVEQVHHKGLHRVVVVMP